ncbi:MAG TPA: hypothetical protein VGI65_15320 [Steroidobacteraceae bacterium]|jgi:hypothetical protein
MLERQHSALVKAQLRYFANNRRRSWRNGVHASFVDASIQLESLLALLVAALYWLVVEIGQGLLRPSLDPHRGSGHSVKLGIGLLLVWVVVSICHNKLKPYEFIPEVEKPYSTPRDRRIVHIYNIGGFAFLVFMFAAASYMRHVFGA